MVPPDTSDSSRHCIYLACCEFSEPASESSWLLLLPAWAYICHIGAGFSHHVSQPSTTVSFQSFMIHLFKAFCRPVSRIKNLTCSNMQSPAYGIPRVATVWTENRILNNYPQLHSRSIGFHHRVVTKPASHWQMSLSVIASE